MKQIEITSEGIDHSAVDLGLFDDLTAYSYSHPVRHTEIVGKVFVGEALKATGAEVSFTVIPPRTAIPYLHQHRKHEEIYVFIKGSGQFLVNDSVFDVQEGSVVRISPNGKRSYRNNSDTPLIFMCIQCMDQSMDRLYVEDGLKAEGNIIWSAE